MYTLRHSGWRIAVLVALCLCGASAGFADTIPAGGYNVNGVAAFDNQYTSFDGMLFWDGLGTAAANFNGTMITAQDGINVDLFTQADITSVSLALGELNIVRFGTVGSGLPEFALSFGSDLWGGTNNSGGLTLGTNFNHLPKVPEPASLSLFGLGLVAAGLFLRRRQ